MTVLKITMVKTTGYVINVVGRYNTVMEVRINVRNVNKVVFLEE